MLFTPKLAHTVGGDPRPYRVELTERLPALGRRERTKFSLRPQRSVPAGAQGTVVGATTIDPTNMRELPEPLYLVRFADPAVPWVAVREVPESKLREVPHE